MAVTLDGARLSDPPSFSVAELERGPPLVRDNAESVFERLALRVGVAIDRGEALIGKAATGRYDAMDAGTLIAVQAGIYRYGEAIDLTAKLVDRAATATRTVLEGGR